MTTIDPPPPDLPPPPLAPPGQDTAIGLPNNRYERMADHLCELPPAERSWRDIQPSRADARDALAELCPAPVGA